MIKRFIFIGITSLSLFSCSAQRPPLAVNTIVGCAKETLLESLNFSNREYSVKNFILDASVPSEGSGGEAYFQNGKLEKIIAGYYGVTGKSELQFWFSSKKNYITDIFDFKYENSQGAMRVSQVGQQRFFVCDNKVLSCEKSEDCSRFEWAQSELSKIFNVIAGNP